MQKSVIALCFFVALSPAVMAADTSILLSKSSHPTGRVLSANGLGDSNCHSTIRAYKDAHGKMARFYNPMECETEQWQHISNYVSLSYPLDGPIINMKGIHEAHHVKIKNGRIILF